MSTGACLVCQGAGSVRTVRGHMVFSRSCPGCAGSGQQRPRPCEPCGGIGQLTRAEAVQVGSRRGSATATVFACPEKAMQGCEAATQGISTSRTGSAHPLYRREGNDLFISVPIAIHEAALGARVDVPTPDGGAKVRVPPGTQSGQRFRLRERGIISTRDGRRGDLVVEVKLVLPRVLDERSKELLREFGRINGENVRESFGETGHGGTETRSKTS